MTNEQPKLENTCVMCRFFVAKTALSGECRRRAPVMVPNNRMNGSGAQGYFPWVLLSHFCGEFDFEREWFLRNEEYIRALRTLKGESNAESDI